MSPEEIITEYGKLMNRAVAIVSGAPYWEGPDGEYAHVTINGDVATLSWPEAESNYDSCSLEGYSFAFPAALLFMDDTRFDEWKAEQVAEAKRQSEARQRAYQEMKRQEELATLAALKAKYERAS